MTSLWLVFVFVSSSIKCVVGKRKQRRMAADGKAASGCGLRVIYNSIFRRRNPFSSPRHPVADSPSLPPSDSKRRRAASDDEASLLVPTSAALPPAAPAPQNSKTVALGYLKAAACRVRRPGQLDGVIHEHQPSSARLPVVLGNLGNIRAPEAVTPSRNVLDYLAKTAKEGGGISSDGKQASAPTPEVRCLALSKWLEPEELKEMGNEEYK